jgi:hypothetical protein
MRIWRALALALALPIGGGAQTGTPDWVARQIDARDTGRDSRTEMTMRLFDRQGRARTRSLTITGLRGAEGRGDRVLVRFTAPADINGTGFLVWEHADSADERFLFLPALGRVRRIAGSETQESFVGSDLTYEDIGGREFEDYTYAFAAGDGAWKAADGSAHEVWRLESRAKTAGAAYPRVVSLIRKDNFVVVEAHIFNRRNEQEKTYLTRRLERVDGIWTAMELTMTNQLQRTRTELTVTAVRYNSGLTEDAFSRRALEAGR